MKLAFMLSWLSLSAVVITGCAAPGSDAPSERKASVTSHEEEDTSDDNVEASNDTEEASNDTEEPAADTEETSDNGDGNKQAGDGSRFSSPIAAFGDAIAGGTPFEALAPAQPGLNFPAPGKLGPIGGAVNDALNRGSEAFATNTSDCPLCF
jgi:hypothetical protein